jgi:7-keto-8-aminopelargonate synthetase-like enzyme
VSSARARAREHTSRSVQKARCLCFCSSHHRGFAVEPRRLEKAAQDAIEEYGLGAGYRTVTLAGTRAMHVELDSEGRIARFKGTEGSVTFTSAYAAPQ